MTPKGKSRVVNKSSDKPRESSVPSVPTPDTPADHKRQQLMVDANNFVYVDGVKVARLVSNGDGRSCLQFMDRDHWRSSRRGSDKVQVAIRELLDALGYP